MITRRDIVKSWIIGAACMAFNPLRSLAEPFKEDSSPRKFQWRIPAVNFSKVRAELKFDGQIMEDKDAGGNRVYVFVGTVLLPYLARAVLALQREIALGGVLIDTREQEIKVYNTRRLSGGIIVVIAPRGTEIFERGEINDPAELVAAFRKGE